MFRQMDHHGQRAGGKKAGHVRETASSYIICAFVKLIQ